MNWIIKIVIALLFKCFKSVQLAWAGGGGGLEGKGLPKCSLKQRYLLSLKGLYGIKTRELIEIIYFKSQITNMITYSHSDSLPCCKAVLHQNTHQEMAFHSPCQEAWTTHQCKHMTTQHRTTLLTVNY